jgi:tetratricopeptide (TPR) repeat protein
VLGVVLVLAAGGGAAWLIWGRRSASAVDPPLPANVSDPEVRLALERARRAVLDKPRSADAWGEYGMTLEAHLYEPEAALCFAEAARLAPDDPRWPYYRGLYALKYEPDRAVRWLRQAAAGADRYFVPNHQTALRLRLAEALLDAGERDEAERLFRDEWERGTDAPRAAYGLGLIAEARGDDQAAADFLTVAVRSPTARRPATARLAALARARGDEAAAARLDKEAAPRPGDQLAWPDPFVELIVRLRVGRDSRLREAEALEGERRYREAAEAYAQSLAEQPSVRAYLGAGLNMARVGEDFDGAVRLVRQAIRLAPDAPQAHDTLAVALLLRANRAPGAAEAPGWLREAAAEARRATELRPDYADAYRHWGQALRRLGEPKEAVAPLRRGVACRPEDLELQLALGEALFEAGDLKGAAEHLENARRLGPDEPRVAEALRRLRMK